MPSPGPRPAPAPAPAQYGANGAGRPATTPDGHPAQPGYGQPPYGTGQFAGGPGQPDRRASRSTGGQPPHPASQPQPAPAVARPPVPERAVRVRAGGLELRSGGDSGQAGYGQGWTPGDGQPGSR